MGARLACLAYGVAAGGELFAAAVVVPLALGRRTRDDALLGLAVLTCFVAALTAALCVLQSVRQEDSCWWGLTGTAPFVIATLTAFVPFVVCMALFSSRPQGPPFDPAVGYLVLVGLFAVNRYDSLVASSGIRGFYLQPFVFLGFVSGVVVNDVARARGAQRALGDHREVGRINWFAETAPGLAETLEPVLELVGPLLGADAVVVLEDRDGRLSTFVWSVTDQARELLEPLAEIGLASTAPGAGAGMEVLPAETMPGQTVVTAPLRLYGRRWGALCFASRAGPAELDRDRHRVQLVAGELTALVRRVRRLEQAQAESAADERNRIARELHDSVSQTLYSIAMVADAFPSTFARDPRTAAGQARQIRAMALQSLGDTRVLLLEMRQTALESASLGGLIEDIGSTSPSPVLVDLNVVAEIELPPEVKLAAYRIAQEAVTNAHLHAAANQIRLRLEQRADLVTVWVIDDGLGFAAGAAPGRHGLEIMRERAEAVGGELSFDSSPGRGTTVRFRWAPPAENLIGATRGHW